MMNKLGTKNEGHGSEELTSRKPRMPAATSLSMAGTNEETDDSSQCEDDLLTWNCHKEEMCPCTEHERRYL